MPPLMTIDVDTTAVVRALRALPDAVQKHVNDASAMTAQAIVHEAQARLRRQVGSAAHGQRSGRASTGQSARSIYAKPAYDGNGSVVLADNEDQPNLPLWLEKGTRVGNRHNFARTPALPYFYVSIELEMGAHERRLADAMGDAADETGLGD
jgi:hypothetical protein